MGKRRAIEPAVTETPAAEVTAPKSEPTPSPIEATLAAASQAPAAEIRLPEATLMAVAPAPRVEIPPVELPKASIVEPAAKVEAMPDAPAAAVAPKPGVRHYALLAASLTFAIVLGALAGAAATFGLAPSTPAPAPVAHSAAADETLALKASVAQLGRELASLKAGIDSIGRSTATQLKSVAERFDRAEKAQERAQVEPAAKLAKISESLDRLERRVATTATPDITGTVTTVDKLQTKPPTIEGWRVVDVYGNRVVLESRAGSFYEIGPGSNLPGVGKVEQIKREDGRIVVVTPKGIITAAAQPQSQPRRPVPYSPYRYY